jgi:hypothetical protein
MEAMFTTKDIHVTPDNELVSVTYSPFHGMINKCALIYGGVLSISEFAR